MEIRNYTDEEKIEIVKLHLEHGRTINSLSDEYGVSVSTISRWIIKYRNNSLRIKET